MPAAVEPLGFASDYRDGASLYRPYHNRPLLRRDPSGLGCWVTFDCTLASQSGGPCNFNCEYICYENRRTDSLSGEGCDEMVAKGL